MTLYKLNFPIVRYHISNDLTLYVLQFNKYNLSYRWISTYREHIKLTKSQRIKEHLQSAKVLGMDLSYTL